MRSAIKALIPTSSECIFGHGHAVPFAINSTSLPRREVVRIPSNAVTCAFDQASIQHVGSEALVVLEDTLGRGTAQPVHISTRIPATCRMSDGVWLLSNESLKIEISNKGRITSILDLKYK